MIWNACTNNIFYCFLAQMIKPWPSLDYMLYTWADMTSGYVTFPTSQLPLTSSSHFNYESPFPSFPPTVSICFFQSLHLLQSPPSPQYRRSWDWRKSGGMPKTAVLGVIYNYITYKTLIWDLKMRGGIGRAAVLGGRRYWGDDCNPLSASLTPRPPVCRLRR